MNSHRSKREKVTSLPPSKLKQPQSIMKKMKSNDSVDLDRDDLQESARVSYQKPKENVGGAQKRPPPPRKLLQEDDEDILESEGFDDDDDPPQEEMIGGPSKPAQKVDQEAVGYASFDDEEMDGESQHVVHQLPVNNGHGFLKQATKASFVRKPTSLQKKPEQKQDSIAISKADTSPIKKAEKQGTRDNSEMILSVDKFEGGSLSKLDTKNHGGRDSLDLPDSTQRFNNSNKGKSNSRNITFEDIPDHNENKIIHPQSTQGTNRGGFDQSPQMLTTKPKQRKEKIENSPLNLAGINDNINFRAGAEASPSPSKRHEPLSMPPVIVRLTTNRQSRLERMVTKKRNQLSAQKHNASIHLDIEQEDVIHEQSQDDIPIKLHDQKQSPPPYNASFSHQERIKKIESIIQEDGIIIMDRYPQLRGEDIEKVDKAFNKLFTPLFKGHHQYLQEKILPSAGIPFIKDYVNDLLIEVNNAVIGFVVSGEFLKPQHRSIYKEERRERKLLEEKYNSEHHLKDSNEFARQSGSPSKSSRFLKPMIIPNGMISQNSAELEEAQRLVRKLKIDRKQREENMKKKIEQQEQEIELRRLEEQLQQEERKRAEQEMKREQIRQRLQEQKEKKQEQKLKEMREKQMRSNPNLLALEYPGMEGASRGGQRSSSWGPRPAGSRLLYKEWEEKFKQREESVTLEERKKKLEELRAMKKPINKDEMEEHARKYEEYKLQHQEKHEKEVKSKKRHDSYNPEKYHTRAYEDLQYYEQAEKEKEEEKERVKRELLEKKQVYGKYVKQQFLPEISKEKEQERINAIEALKHPVRMQQRISPGTRVEIPIPEKHVKSTISRNNQSRSADQVSMAALSRREKANASNSEIGEDGKSPSGSPARKPLKSKRQKNEDDVTNAQSIMLPPKAQPKPKDYLRERRKKREREQLLKEQEDAAQYQENAVEYEKEQLQRLIDDKKLTQKQKVEMIKQKARELEEKALQKQKRTADSNSFYGPNSNITATTRGTTGHNQQAGVVEGALEANDMLIDAIKAKLAILDNLE